MSRFGLAARGWQLALCAGSALALISQCSVAHAFSEPRIYGDSPLNGGGDGRWFTGSPAEGYGCEVCHTGQYSLPLYQTGLPLDGYVPGKKYVVRLSWPQAAQRAQMFAAAGAHPNTSLNAEFVAEDGSASGEVVLEPNHAMPSELCTNTPAGALPLMGGTLFKPVKNAAPTESNKCSADMKGDRCILAVRPCGTSELRFVWTAPTQWRGPIWFSAGFVTTDDATGAPNDNDNVTSLVIPMNAASDGPIHETTLQGGCSVQRVPESRHGLASLLPLMAAAVLSLRSRRRRALASPQGARSNQ